MRRVPLGLLVISIAASTGCQKDSECAMTSTVAAFEPLCLGSLNRYVGESRLFVSGSGGEIIVYLPAELAPGAYGGQSGQPMSALLATASGESLSHERLSTVTFASIGADDAELRLHLEFDEGVVEGPLRPSIDDVRPDDSGAGAGGDDTGG